MNPRRDKIHLTTAWLGTCQQHATVNKGTPSAAGPKDFPGLIAMVSNLRTRV
jgi:hypothetical protein